MSNPARRVDTETLRTRKLDRATFVAIARSPIALVLDGVHGAYNQGALFRLADAFLLEHLHFCGAELKPRNRRFKTAARGTTRWVPHTVGQGVLEVVDGYRARGYPIVALEQAVGSVPLQAVTFSERVCLVLGAEMDGVSEPVLDRADAIVELPNLGMANSLNIAMSAAIVVARAHRELTG